MELEDFRATMKTEIERLGGLCAASRVTGVSRFTLRDLARGRTSPRDPETILARLRAVEPAPASWMAPEEFTRAVLALHGPTSAGRWLRLSTATIRLYRNGQANIPKAVAELARELVARGVGSKRKRSMLINRIPASA